MTVNGLSDPPTHKVVSFRRDDLRPLDPDDPLVPGWAAYCAARERFFAGVAVRLTDSEPAQIRAVPTANAGGGHDAH